jgi:hypothetical protein
LLAVGVAWLWEHGWFLWWLVAAAAVSLVVWGGLRVRQRPLRSIPVAEPEALTERDPTWAPHEQAAWDTVRSLSGKADLAMLNDRRLMLAAARETIEAVAQHYHPGRPDPALEFTLPELLLLTERASARMRMLLLEHVPGSHRVKAGHILRVWGYQPMLSSALAHGRKAYSVLRILRVISPLNAAIAELRDRIVDDLFDNLQAQVRRKIVHIWIEEIGRAAIDLYSGRLRVDAVQLAEAAAGEGLHGAASAASLPGALRLLVAGQTKAGKSTLVNALLGELSAAVDVLPLTAEFEGYELRQDGAPAAYLIDTPGLESETQVAELIERALVCDLIVWVAPAHRADRALDRAALDALRARFASDPQRKIPPIVVVASHVDRLSPSREWAPPYNVDAPDRRKEQSIRAALEAIAADLLVPVETIVPARLDGPEPYNLDLLRSKLTDLFGEAQRARWIRIQRESAERGDWRQTWKQLAGAGRMVGELVKR